MPINEPDQEIIQRYLNGTASAAEALEVEEWYRSFTEGKLNAEIQDTEKDTENRMLARLKENIQFAPKPAPAKTFPIVRWVAAACILIISAVAIYILVKPVTIKDPVIAKVITNDILPGYNRATLTLSSGKLIVLDSTASATITDENISIKNNFGQLVYIGDRNSLGNSERGSFSPFKKGGSGQEHNETLRGGFPAYNTISTPRGGQYQLTLSDGTKAWLNANSSIHFPVMFTGKERNVQITGEVYFEIAENKTKPFSVSTNRMTVEVLGTHFNINSYQDEPEINTTLLEGAVKIKSAGKEKILKPGEQAQVINEKIEINNKVNIDQVMAWKNGLFRFENTSLEVVLRQLSRWYDVDIVYNGKIPDKKFGGGISRKNNLSQVLQILEESQVKFKIEGKKIIVNAN
jgi:transmembrane sensor